MKILYDHQIFTLQNYGGISRYFCELMEQLSFYPDVELTLALYKSRNENLRKLCSLNQDWSNRLTYGEQRLSVIQKVKHAGYPVLRKIAYLGFPVIQKVMSIDALNRLQINQRESVRMLDKQDFDIFHPTYYDPYFMKSLEKKPFVLTVHDMIHEIYPDFFSPYDRTKEGKKQLIENASSIIAISESTKRDILKLFHVDPDLIHVIYHGSPFENAITTSADIPLNALPLNKPYVLYVGSRQGYKNFIFFISVMAELLEKNEDLHVCCAGGGPFTPSELKLLSRLNISSKVYFVKPDDQIMKRLYENAEAFIFPSLYEGFGLPILEAFSCGCPAILSDSSSLPEIGGDAASYFEPSDPESLIQSIEVVLTDSHYRDQCIKKGFERLKLFSWEKTAQDTKNVYESLLY